MAVSRIWRWLLRLSPSVGAFIAMTALALSGCGGDSGPEAAPPGPEPAVVWRDLQIDGVARRYRLYTPPTVGEDRPVPLVLALHGSENSVQSFVEATGLDQAASANEFVVAYPEASDLVWHGGFCCTGGRGDPTTDIRFLDQVISDVAAVRPIDTARVYAVGVSGGGVMAYRLACHLTGRLAGAGSVSGAMLLEDCQPARPISVMEIHGTADGIVPYAGGRIRGGATAPAPATAAVVEHWALLNRCPGPPRTEVDGLVTTATWSGCGEGAGVRLVTVEGGGHNWFAKVYGPPNGAVDATHSIVEYFGLARRR